MVLRWRIREAPAQLFAAATGPATSGTTSSYNPRAAARHTPSRASVRKTGPEHARNLAPEAASTLSNIALRKAKAHLEQRALRIWCPFRKTDRTGEYI